MVRWGLGCSALRAVDYRAEVAVERPGAEDLRADLGQRNSLREHETLRWQKRSFEGTLSQDAPGRPNGVPLSRPA
eukprot:9492473-Pyramimonas_sp.AAC.1